MATQRRNTSCLEVYEQQCENCLLSPDRLVSSSRAKEYLDHTLSNDSFFICHKSSINGGNVCCRAFYDTFGRDTVVVRLAMMLDLVKFVPLPTDKLDLLSHRELSKRGEANDR